VAEKRAEASPPVAESELAKTVKAIPQDNGCRHQIETITCFDTVDSMPRYGPSWVAHGISRC